MDFSASELRLVVERHKVSSANRVFNNPDQPSANIQIAVGAQCSLRLRLLDTSTHLFLQSGRCNANKRRPSQVSILQSAAIFYLIYWSHLQFFF